VQNSRQAGDDVGSEDRACEVDSLPSFLLLDHGSLGIAYETKYFSQDAMQAAMQKPLVRLSADNECMMKTDQNPTRIAHPRRQAPVSQCTSHISLPNMQAAKPIHCHLHTCAVPDIDRHADRPKPWAASSFRSRFRIQSHVHAYGRTPTHLDSDAPQKRLKHVYASQKQKSTTSMSKHSHPSKAKTPTQNRYLPAPQSPYPRKTFPFPMP
jgi:hypothetical protein